MNTYIGSRAGQRRGFALVELLIVVIMLGVPAAIVIPQFSTSNEDARRQAFVSQMRSYVTAAEYYRFKTGQYLADSGSGECPAGWEGYIDVDRWTAGTPIGGVWDVEQDSYGIRSGFGVHFWGNNGTQDDAYMQKIDAVFDNGDLCTGQFRKIAGDRFYYVLADN